MDLQLVSDFLLWCLIVNYSILVLWFLAMVFAPAPLLRLHGRWFKLTREHFDAIHYAGMALYKIGIFLFNVAPYIALRIVAAHAG